MPTRPAGQRRIFYNNFAGHLLNAYNPNMLHPALPYRWRDDEWERMMAMVADAGFDTFEFWLEPALFCRQAFAKEYGREFERQINVIIAHAARHGLDVEAIVALTTVGPDWHTHCPNVPAEWAEVRWLWDEWTRRLPGLKVVGIFPGDPGGCSRHGCTAETYIDRSVEIAELVRRNLPGVEIEFNTWGPPIFGWGLIEGPPNWQGEFIQQYQGSAWRFDAERTRRAMTHLIRRLPDFPPDTVVGINLGFNPDGMPTGEQDARPWVREIARTNPVRTWDFSLTEGENAIFPHWRLERLFAQRREERAVGAYCGGICFSMTPKLNQLSLAAAARSFAEPDADPDAFTAAWCQRLFGPGGCEVARHFPQFEVVPDWGHHVQLAISRAEYHREMGALRDALHSLAGAENATVPFFPSLPEYRQELEFYAGLFADLAGPAPDYDELRTRYWRRVYAIYDQLPDHVDPRPRFATDHLINHFRGLK